MSTEKEQLLEKLSADRALAAQVFFPHRHAQATPQMHVDIMDLWRCQDELVVIEAFREAGKSSLAEEFILMEAHFKNFKYTLVFGETYTKACQRLEAIKHEIVTNHRLHELFGRQKGAVWSENRIILKNGACIECHGWEEEIRGYKYLDSRPDRCLLDDIENKERVRDTASVDENWRKLHLELIPALDSSGFKLRFTQTPLAEDCMLTRALKSPNWVHGRFPICDLDIDDPKAKSLWPERRPMEDIRAKRDMFASEGMLREFNQEYMLIASGSQGKSFEEDMLRFEDLPPRVWRPRKVIIDPARTTDITKSDHSGYVVVSRIGTTLYVHESGGNYWKPDEVVANAFELSERHEDAEVSIEKNSLEEWLAQPIRAHSLTTGKSLKLRLLQAPQERSKDQFILGLQPFFKARDVVLVGGRDKHRQLVSQILNFPSGKKDVLNALAYSTRVFSGVPVYGDFGQANITFHFEPSRKAALLLGVNHTANETAAVLCALDGQHLTVLADWISPLTPSDAIPDIAMLIRAVYPGRQIAVWVPADVYDQVGRNPLMPALKVAGWRPARGEHSTMTRGSLSPMLRTELNGRRMLRVNETARETLNALADGYHWLVKSNGERESDPERNAARTLVESLETLTFALSRVDTSAKLETNAVNANGQPYFSAFKGRG